MNRRGTDKLSESLEDYLEAIAELIEVDGHAHTKEIAKKLDVKMPSVTVALKQLAHLGYIEYNTHFPVQLTASGKIEAGRIRRHHRILCTFFAGVLGVPATIATETACRLEHVVDEETIERFVLFSEAITRRDEAAALRTFLTEAIMPANMQAQLLSDCATGSQVSVSYIGRNAGSDLPLKVGDIIVAGAFSLDGTRMSIELAGKQLYLPRRQAENIWVAIQKQS